MSQSKKSTLGEWLDFQKRSHSFMHQGFAHPSLLSINLNLSYLKHKLTIKENLSHSLDRAEGLQLLVNIRKNSFLFVRAENQSLSVEYDNGVQQQNGLKSTAYFGFNYNLSNVARQIYAGVEVLTDNKWSANTKATFNLNKKNLKLEEKILYLRNRWRFNAFSSLDVFNTTFGKSGLLVQFFEPANENSFDSKCSYFLRLQNTLRTTRTFPLSLFENIFFNFTKSIHQNHTVGVEAKLASVFANPLQGSKQRKILENLYLCYEKKTDKSVIKARISTNLSVALSVKSKFQNYCSYSLGGKITFGKRPKTNWGLKIELDV